MGKKLEPYEVLMGVQTYPDMTMGEFLEELRKKEEWMETARGFKTVITKDDLKPMAQDLINEVGLMPNSPSFFKNTRPIGERSYYNYAYARGKNEKV